MKVIIAFIFIVTLVITLILLYLFDKVENDWNYKKDYYDENYYNEDEFSNSNYETKFEQREDKVNKYNN